MNRPIKYRAFVGDLTNKMYHNVYFDDIEVYIIDDECQRQVVGDRDKDSMLPQATLMQFTGMTDCDGVEIYEGDRVEYFDLISDEYILNKEKTTGSVGWYPSRCALIIQADEENHKGGHYITHWDMASEIKVIGNIHENKG